MRLMTRAFSLKLSLVGFKKRKKKLALFPSACLFSVVSSPAFYGGWGIEGGSALGAVGGRGGGRPVGRVRGGGRGKTNVKAPNVLLALPFPVRPFIRSFSFE